MTTGKLALGLALAAASCGRAPRPAATGPASPGAAAVAGVWDGVSRSRVGSESDDDTRTERQEWHLRQSGGALRGFTLVETTVESGDGHPYQCNNQTSFQAMSRFELRGRVEGGRVDLEEVSQAAEHGACDLGERQLLHYRGEIRGDILMLVGGVAAAPPDARRVLYRRPAALVMPEDEGEESTDLGADAAAAPARAQAAAVAELLEGVRNGGPPAEVAGIWIWEHAALLPGEDQKLEREEWHVTQEGPRLHGWYDRTVRQLSIDGHAYRCSGTLEFRIGTRYRFTGEVSGDRISIKEGSFEITDPSPCDNGIRRLDTYQGLVDGEEVRLVWSAGAQVLRRARPDVPTQRF